MIVSLVIFALVLRLRALAALGLGATFLIGYAFATEVTVWMIVITATMVFVAVRYGLLAASVSQATFQAVFQYPLFSGAGWESMNPLPLIVILVVSMWAFRTSLGGQSAFAGSMLDE